MTDEEIEQRTEEAQRHAVAASELLPERTSFGLATWSDGPPAAGGGVGALLWFDTRDELLDFVGGPLVFLAPGPEPSDCGAVADEVAALVRALPPEGSLADAIPALNRALRGFSQLAWSGTLEDLLTGDGAFARDLRRQHHEQDEESGLPLDRPIAATDVEAFVEGLADWGL